MVPSCRGACRLIVSASADLTTRIGSNCRSSGSLGVPRYEFPEGITLGFVGPRSRASAWWQTPDVWARFFRILGTVYQSQLN
jgi:hypothetical protein